jgi:hypothetical protein
MMMVDMTSRWTYKGSVTTPPCATTVYWNVVKKIYPVSQKHFDQFKNQMKRGANKFASEGPAAFTNYREIQPLGDREVTHIFDDAAGGGGALLIVVIILLILLLVTLAVLYKKTRAAGNPTSAVQASEMSKTNNQ